MKLGFEWLQRAKNFSIVVLVFTNQAVTCPHLGAINFLYRLNYFLDRYRVCLNTVYLLKTYCWKHHSKIIFKCVNSTMKLKFILKSMFWWLLWVRKQCHGIHIFLAKCTNGTLLKRTHNRISVYVFCSMMMVFCY